MRYRLYDARGYDFPIERRYNRLWRTQVTDDEDGFAPPTLLAATTEPALRALGLLGVADIMQPPGEPPLQGLRATYEGPRRAHLCQPARDAARLGRGPPAGGRGRRRAAGGGLGTGLRPAREAIVSKPVRGVGSGSGGDAEITRYEADRVELTVRADGPGIAVLSDVHYPGWKATLDGKEVPIERVDYLLRGVAVQGGEHRIVMTYAPWSWRAGWIVSLLAALGLLAAAMWKGGRR